MDTHRKPPTEETANADEPRIAKAVLSEQQRTWIVETVETLRRRQARSFPQSAA